MTELEKLEAGEEYYFLDSEVAKRKARAAHLCEEFNQISANDPEAQTKKLKKFLAQLVSECQSKQILIVTMAKIFMWVKIF